MEKSDFGAQERLCEYIKAEMKRLMIPGVSLGIVNEGSSVTRFFGITSTENPLEVGERTLFQIGSITKTFTGTLIMMLAEEGKIGLDEPVRSYIPDFCVADPEASEGATIRHLLTHTGGWSGDYFEDTGGEDALGRYVRGMADLEQLAPLGFGFSYNNAGFAVAGGIIEIVTGKRYSQALREMVLEPLGVETCYFGPEMVMTKRFAVGHRASTEKAEVQRPWPLPPYANPIGGIACHIRDLLTYARFHLGDGLTESGARLLQPDSLKEMHSPAISVWGKEGWGLPFSVDDTHGFREVSHGGGTLGQTSLLVLVPERGFAFAMLTNADRGSTLCRKSANRAYHEYLGIEVEDPKPIESSEEELLAFVGKYKRPFAELEIGLLGGRLAVQVTQKKGFPKEDSPLPPLPPPMSLARCEPDRLLVQDGPMADSLVDAIRSEDGSVGWVRWAGRLHRRCQ